MGEKLNKREVAEAFDCSVVFTTQGKAIPAIVGADGILIHYSYYPGGSFILVDGNKKYMKGTIDDEEYIYPVRFEDEREWIDFNNSHPEIDTFENIRRVAKAVNFINKKWMNYFLDAWDFFLAHDIKNGLREFCINSFIEGELCSYKNNIDEDYEKEGKRKKLKEVQEDWLKCWGE